VEAYPPKIAEAGRNAVVAAFIAFALFMIKTAVPFAKTVSR
jgi:hypothetical protein